MIGPIVKVAPEELPQAPNLHYLGKRDYCDLPRYLAHFDVALIPFARNEATRYLSPTKTLEYLAAYRPVVSTPIHDVISLYGDAVHIGVHPRDFCDAVESALTQSPEVHRAISQQLVLGNTWDSIAQRMLQKMEARFQPISPVRQEKVYEPYIER